MAREVKREEERGRGVLGTEKLGVEEEESEHDCAVMGMLVLV